MADNEKKNEVAATDIENVPAKTTLKDLTFYAPNEVADKERYISQVKEYLLSSKNQNGGQWPAPSNNELLLFMQVAKAAGLNPLTKQIYGIYRAPRKGEEPILTIQTSIDGLRAIAEKSKFYAGSDEGQFDYRPDFNEGKYPEKVSVTVYKINRISGERMPTTATAKWNEYFPGEWQGKMWMKMPETMLEKVAEAKALRKAFPNTAGLYVDEEMQQASAIIIEPGDNRAKIDENIKAAKAKLIEGEAAKESKDAEN